MRVADAEPAADGRAQGHDGRTPDLLEAAGQHGVVVGVGQDDEALSHSCSAASSSSTASGSRVSSSPMTSSLIQSVSKASRASLAVRTASEAVKQPAVLGRTSTPRARSTSRTPPRAAGSTRRTATVANDEPEASMTASRTSGLEMPPVPMTRRESSTVPAITNAAVVVHRQPPAAAVTISTTSRGTAASWPTRCAARRRGCAPLRSPRATGTTGDDVGHRRARARARPTPFTTIGGIVVGVGGAGCGLVGRRPVCSFTHLSSMALRSRAGARRAEANRPGPNGANSSGGSPPATIEATAVAVIGANKMPWR